MPVNCILISIILFIVLGCNSSGVSKEKQTYEFQEEEIILNDTLMQRLGNWAEIGKKCYGIVEYHRDGRFEKGNPVKSIILRIKSDSIQMKALEKVQVLDSVGCERLGLTYGEKWWEKDGDLFLTKEEAMEFLKNKELEKRKKSD